MQAYTRLDRTEDAIVTFRQMEANPDIDVDLTALNLFVDALSRGGRMEAAERVLLRASEAARQSGVLFCFAPGVVQCLQLHEYLIPLLLQPIL